MQSSEGKELLSHMNLDNLFGKASDFDITYEAEGFCVEHFTLDTDNLSPKNWLHWRALEPDLRKMVKNIYLSKQEIANMFHSIIESDLTLLLNPEEHRNFMHQVTQFKSISERFTSLQKELSLSKKEDLNPLVEYALRELDFAEAQEKIEDILKIVEYNQTHSPAREAFDSTRQLFKEIVKQERGTELQEVMLDEHEVSDSDIDLAGLAGLGSASL
jgi:uncharacterized protein YqcC (DUF446 family)